jgi:hypothetical protein
MITTRFHPLPAAGDFATYDKNRMNAFGVQTRRLQRPSTFDVRTSHVTSSSACTRCITTPFRSQFVRFILSSLYVHLLSSALIFPTSSAVVAVVDAAAAAAAAAAGANSLNCNNARSSLASADAPELTRYAYIAYHRRTYSIDYYHDHRISASVSELRPLVCCLSCQQTRHATSSCNVRPVNSSNNWSETIEQWTLPFFETFPITRDCQQAVDRTRARR